MFGKVKGTSVEAYAHTPFAHGFAEISEELGLYHRTVKDYQAIISDLRANEGEGAIDMVILATSIYELVGFQFCSKGNSS